MAEQNLGPRDFFAKEDAIADLGLIACPGAEELCKLVDSHLVRWAREVGNTDVDTFIIPSDCPRFQSGDAKGLVKASTRGDDLYIFVDPGNYSVTYQLFGYENHLSPDDHFQNLMRLIAPTASASSCPACTAAASIAASAVRAWTAPLRCSSCATSVSRTSSRLTHMTPAL